MRTTFPRKLVGISGGEFSHWIAPSREGKSPSIGSRRAGVVPCSTLLSSAEPSIETAATAMSIATSKSWFAFMMHALHIDGHVGDEASRGPCAAVSE